MSTWRPKSDRDHPRLRGDHSDVTTTGWRRPGSSPPARGPPGRPRRRSLRTRIIPACAGTTVSLPARDRERRDHSRLRGDHCFWRVFAVFLTGSSPPARGPLAGRQFSLGKSGIIPACAGTTHGCLRSPVLHGDHPRLRGDHEPIGSIAVLALGSSPPARGPRFQNR